MCIVKSYWNKSIYKNIYKFGPDLIFRQSAIVACPQRTLGVYGSLVSEVRDRLMTMSLLFPCAL